MAIDTVKIETNSEIFTMLNIDNFATNKRQAQPTEKNLFDKSITLVQSAPLLSVSTRDQHGAYVQVNAYGEVIIEFSSKCLREKYFEGLTINNIEQALKNINETLSHYCRIDEKKLIETSSIVKVHNSFNLKTEKTLSRDIIYSLQTVGHMNYKTVDARYDSTCYFKTAKESLTIYDKIKAMQDELDMEGVCSIDDFLKSQFTLLRSEYKLDNKKKVKEVYNKLHISTDLQTVLKPKNSNIVLLHSIDKIESKDDNLIISDAPDIMVKQGYSHAQIHDLYGYVGVYETYGCNPHKLREFLKSSISDKGNLSKKFKQYEKSIIKDREIKKVSIDLNCSETLYQYKRLMKSALSA
jgi:hypothetical protein